MYFVKKILNLFFPTVSSRPARFPAGNIRVRALAALLLAVLVGLAGPARAGVVWIGPTHYRLDNGPAVTGMWEIAEKLAYAKDAAVVVVDPKAPASLVQPLLRLLEALKVPTVLTRKADYQELVKRGLLRPAPTP